MTSKKEPEVGEKKENFISKLKTRIKNSVTNSNTKICVGIFLLILCLYVFVAYVNFFFTSSTDASLIEAGVSPTQIAEDGAENASGFSGAVIADFLVNKTFGVSSFCIIIVLSCIGWKILTSFKLNLSRIIGSNLFWMLWLSLFFGLVCTPFSDNSSIFWGGLHGQNIATTLNTYIGVFGTSLVLFAALMMYITLMYPNVIDNIKIYFDKKKEGKEVSEEDIKKENEKSGDDTANTENKDSEPPHSEAEIKEEDKVEENESKEEEPKIQPIVEPEIKEKEPTTIPV